MQQFTVPQFIDVEDKVFGPITVRQFLIMLFCAVMSAIMYRLLDLLWFVLATFLIFAAGIVVAFFRINGRPFHFFILNLFQTIFKPKVRLWNNQLGKNKLDLTDVTERKAVVVKTQAKPRYGSSKLAEVSLVVDTGGMYQGGDQSVRPLDRRDENQPRTIDSL